MMFNEDNDTCLTRKERDELLEKIYTMLSLVSQNVYNTLDLLDKIVKSNLEHQYLMNHGIEGFREMVLESFRKQSKEGKINRLHGLFMHDRELSHPHQKILSFLLEQYDFEKGCFGRVFFSRIVKECRFGKNKAREYLDFVGKKGYIKKQNDGYRVWYYISEVLLDSSK